MNSWHLTDLAASHLDEIWDYIAVENFRPESARRVIKKLYDTFEYLGGHPGAGTARNELRPGMRSFSPRKPAQNYVVFFQRLAETVEIVAVVHGSRDYQRMFEVGLL